MSSCCGFPLIPLPAIFKNARTLVWDTSITWDLNWGKFLQPEVPASTTVVTPDLKLKSSGETLDDPSAKVRTLPPTNTWVCKSIKPGTTHNPAAWIVFLDSPSESEFPTAAIFPLEMAISITLLI